MLQTITDVHQQFASFFGSEVLKPYAYLVSKKLAEGHICLDLDEAKDDLADESVLLNPAALKKNSWVSVDTHVKRPFILHANRLYLQRYFSYETDILERIKSFLNTNPASDISLTAHEELISSLFPKSDKEDGQKIAAISAVTNNLTIITGGPGTGKTTTVAKILTILYAINPALKVALVAPTGKAAVRMSESLRSAAGSTNAEKLALLQPLTIHRLLGFKRDSPYFRHDKDNPLTYDLVIADESSMIDAALFAKLMNAIGEGTRLILLGDKNQLASVEAGSLFGDLCNSVLEEVDALDGRQFLNEDNSHGSKTHPLLRSSSFGRKTSPSQEGIKPASKKGKSIHSTSQDRMRPQSLFQEGIKPKQLALFLNADISQQESTVSQQSIKSLSSHIVELKTSFRFSADKGIGKFSKAVINNEEEIIKAFILDNDNKELQIDTSYDEELFENFIKGYEAYINEPDINSAIKAFNKLRILCAIKSGDQGIHTINKKVEKYLSQQKLIKTAAEFYEHRPIMVTKNYYELELYNGDVGIIRKDENGNLKAWFENGPDNVKAVPPGFLAESETVFAMTIHKSQGSEYDQVLVMLPDAEMPLLTAELLYTGVTRAKSKVLIQSAEDVLRSTAAKRVKRASGITERLKEENLL